MIEAITMIGDKNEVSAPVFKNLGDLVEVANEVGLVLNNVATEHGTKVLVNTGKIRWLGYPVDVGNFFGIHSHRGSQFLEFLC